MCSLPRVNFFRVLTPHKSLQPCSHLCPLDFYESPTHPGPVSSSVKREDMG